MANTLADIFSVKRRYSRSVNLERDLEQPDALQGYILTERSVDALRRILSGLREGTSNAWTLTSVYGTGKSAFAHYLASWCASSKSQLGITDSKPNQLEEIEESDLDPGLTTCDRLREILLNLHSPESLLLSKESRDLLFKFLRPQEAEILALVLSAPKGEDVYRALQQVKIRQGSENERTLFDFFELIVPSKEEVKEVPSLEQIAPQYSLFAHQRQAAKQVKQYLQQEPRRVLLHMPTGAGKTRTAMNIIADRLRSHEPTLVIWLAYSEELCEQAVAEFQKAWQYLGDRELTVYRFWGDLDLDIDRLRDGVVVAGLTKVYNAAKRSIQFINQLGSRSSLVIIDEAHQAIAETYRLVLDALVIPYPKTALLGLTATPGRTWLDINADAKLAEFFAKQKVKLSIPGYDNPIDYLVAEGYLAKAEYRSLLYQSGLELSQRDLNRIGEELDLPGYLLHRIEEDEQRNLRIILEIEELAQRHQRIIVFTISVEHSKLIASVLQTRGLSAYTLSATTSASERSRLIGSFKDDVPETKILCNYGVLTTGFDAPRTSAAVIARPTKSLVLCIWTRVANDYDYIPGLWKQEKNFDFDRSGTLVVWSNIDRCMWKTGKTIIDNSELLIGRMYRKFLEEGQVSIRMLAFDLDNPSNVITEKSALPNDPGYLMAKTSCPRPFDNKPMFQPWEEVGQYEAVFTIDFCDRQHEVKVRFSYAKEEARQTYGGNPGDLPHGKHAAKNIGVSIVRAGRELDLDQSLVIKYDPTERWWGIEIEFPPSLDDLFGVTNNKQSARNFAELINIDIDSLLQGGKTITQAKEELR